MWLTYIYYINKQTVKCCAIVWYKFVQMEQFCLLLKERLEDTAKVHGSIGSVLVS